MPDIISLVIVLAVLGVAYWLITTYLPIAEPFMTIIKVVVVLAVVVWLLQRFL